MTNPTTLAEIFTTMEGSIQTRHIEYNLLGQRVEIRYEEQIERKRTIKVVTIDGAVIQRTRLAGPKAADLDYHEEVALVMADITTAMAA